jgi:hypothetical protein
VFGYETCAGGATSIRHTYRIFMTATKKAPQTATGATGLSRRAERGYITNSGTSAGFGAEGTLGFGAAMSV